VLVLCLGRATKLVEQIMDQPKVYRAVARLDATSDSFDSARPLIPVTVPRPPTRAALEAVLRGFEGEIEQVPPMISAVKVGGLPAYRRVLKGQSPELKARPVRIYWVHLQAYDWPTLELEMACGRGTYVRSLIRDVGQRLETGGILTRLTRTRVGPFCISNSGTLDQVAGLQFPLTGLTNRPPWFVPIDEARRLLAVRPIPLPERPSG
jgi:tRNA pseudouridine55 synthase